MKFLKEFTKKYLKKESDKLTLIQFSPQFNITVEHLTEEKKEMLMGGVMLLAQTIERMTINLGKNLREETKQKGEGC